MIGMQNSDEEHENINWVLMDRIIEILKENQIVIPPECIAIEEQAISPLLSIVKVKPQNAIKVNFPFSN